MGRGGWSRRGRSPVQLLQPGGRKVQHLVASGLPVPTEIGDLPRICDKCQDLCLEILAETSPI
jgi:hypothetical protein